MPSRSGEPRAGTMLAITSSMTITAVRITALLSEPSVDMSDTSVSKYMTREVVCLRRTDTVLRARDAMDNGELRHLPIVDEGNRLVGIISDLDVIAAIATGERRTVVGDIMTHPVLSVTAGTPAHEAVACLLQHKIGALPVVADDGGVLVGIVTETDFLRVALRTLRSEAGDPGPSFASSAPPPT